MHGVALLALCLACAAGAQELQGECLFAPEPFHNHSPGVVETADGDLIACWFHGHGERGDDTLVINGARKRNGGTGWSAPFPMADNPGLPDQNPVLFLDPRGTLWLFWISTLDNEVRSYTIWYKTSRDFAGDGPPKWDWQDMVVCRPQDFEASFLAARNSVVGKPRSMAADKLFQRLGWMTRQPPIMLSDSRMALGLYSDVFDCSLIAFTDDWGKSWQFSKPMVFPVRRNIQPALVRKKSGGLAAFMRATSHVRRAESNDGGMTWTEKACDIPNPGSSVACIALQSGRWLLVCNDMRLSRVRLTALLSDDQGETWKWKKSIENLSDGGSAAYPTVIQGRNGTIHCVYSLKNPAQFRGSTIKHVRFGEAWVQAPGSQSSPAAGMGASAAALSVD